MTEMPDAATTGSAAPGAEPETKPPAQKPPARPAAEIRADIVKERAALGGSFENLRSELDEMVDASKRRASGLGRRARVIAPAAGAVLALGLFLRSRARGRRG